MAKIRVRECAKALNARASLARSRKKKYNKEPVSLRGVRQGEEAYVRVVETDRWGMTQQGHAGYGQK